MSEKNALAILGSPHTNGTTAAMLDFAADSYVIVGRFPVYHLSEYKYVYPCKPGNRCRKKVSFHTE